jgi:hypothetical protein
MRTVSVLHYYYYYYYYYYYFLWLCSPARALASSFTRFRDHTRRAIVGRTPLDEWSARRRDLYMTIHNTQNRQTSMPPVGFEPTIAQASGRRPPSYTAWPLDMPLFHFLYYMFNRTAWAMDRSILKALLTCNMPMQKTMSFLLCRPGELGLANAAWFIGRNVPKVCAVYLLSLL